MYYKSKSFLVDGLLDCMVSYSVEAIRSRFPALARKENGKTFAYFDGPGGTQMVDRSIDAFSAFMKQGNANLGRQYLTSHEVTKVVQEAREAAADFLGVVSKEIVFGANMTTLMFSISRAIARDWNSGDEIVVTEMDHRANVDPWRLLAEEKGVEVKWLRLDVETFELDYHDLESRITDKTRLVAIGHSSNGIGTVNNLVPVIKRAREVGALVVIDAVHAAPHFSLNLRKLDVDLVFCSAYKFYGPHIGIAAIRYELGKKLKPYKVTSSPKKLPENFETGTQNFGMLSATTEAIKFIASLGEGDTRRSKLASAFSKINKTEVTLADKLRKGIVENSRVTLFQSEGKKTPTVAFRVKGISPKMVAQQLAKENVFVENGHFYAETIGDVLKINDTGGWVRAGIVVYTNEDDVNRLISAVSKLKA